MNKARITVVNARADEAIQKLRNIKKLASLGGPIAHYHIEELREIIDSLRHNCNQLNTEQGIPLIEIL